MAVLWRSHPAVATDVPSGRAGKRTNFHQLFPAIQRPMRLLPRIRPPDRPKVSQTQVRRRAQNGLFALPDRPAIVRPRRGSRPRSATLQPPQTRYARSGDVRIAYQVVGNGPIDLVFVPGFISHVDHVWNEPRWAGFLERLGCFSLL